MCIKQPNSIRRPARRRCSRRRGTVIAMVTVSLVMVVGIAAVVLDVARLRTAQTELQAAADAAALAGAIELLSEDRLKGPEQLDGVVAAAHLQAQSYGQRNRVDRSENVIDVNEDINVGHWTFETDTFAAALPAGCNSVRVTVRRDGERGAPISLMFAQVFGRSEKALTAQATAAFEDAVTGYRVTPRTGNAMLLPFALKETSWLDLHNGLAPPRDEYFYDPETGEVRDGSDGIMELNLYPGAGAGQLPPGNFGTVDIGAANNSTQDIARQILYGVNADDLAYFGGSLEFDENGIISLNGDTGLSAGVKDELAAIIGQPRSIPLFQSVSGPGNNANYEVVAFAGVRIMHVKLTGPMNRKELVIQPAVVVDDAATSDPRWAASYGVYRPVTLVK